MGQTIKELAAQKAAQIKADAKAAADEAAKGAMPGATDVTKTAEDREQTIVTNFYKAFIDKDRALMAKVSNDIAEDYKKKGQSVAVNADGGYLVPTSVAASILEKRRTLSQFRQLATTISGLTAPLDLPTEATKPTAYWVDEGAAITESKSTFDRKKLQLFKVAGLVTFTYESMKQTAVNPSLQAVVESQLAFQITAKENDAIVNGDGLTKPFGFRSSDITPASAAIAGASLAAGDLTKLRRRLPAAYRQYGAFITSGVGAGLLEDLKDSTGRPLWRADLTGENPDKLLGRPLIEMDEIPSNLGAGTNETEVWFIDPSYYWLGTGEAMRVDWGTSNDDFARDQIKLRLIDEIGGRPSIGEAFAKLTAVK